VGGACASLKEGVKQAAGALDSGAARAKFEQFRDFCAAAKATS